VNLQPSCGQASCISSVELITTSITHHIYPGTWRYYYQLGAFLINWFETSTLDSYRSKSIILNLNQTLGSSPIDVELCTGKQVQADGYNDATLTATGAFSSPPYAATGVVMEVEANAQSSINLLEPWRCHTKGGCHDDLPISPLDLSSDDLNQVPRCPGSDPLFEALMGDAAHRTTSKLGNSDATQKKTTGSKAWVSQLRPETSAGFSFPSSDEATAIFSPLSIQIRPTLTISQGIKRRRYTSDVDGFNTGGLSVKKRRLRADLITSRLSQPYSQPATHILNREGQEAGDKRFLKMATSVDLTRRIAHLHATSFLRFSVMNRLRQRLNQGQPARRHEQEIEAITSKVTSKSNLKPPILQDSAASRSFRIAPTGTGLAGPQSFISSTKPQPNQQGLKPFQHSKPTSCRLSKPAALPLPVGDVAATKKRTSPRLFPIQSPELRPTVHLPPLDDLEEDSFAYMHPADDDWDDIGDDQDSVYSDFSVVFGQNGDNNEEDDRSYEEYLDELDGICWMSR
jgi:hypothetical protein